MFCVFSINSNLIHIMFNLELQTIAELKGLGSFLLLATILLFFLKRPIRLDFVMDYFGPNRDFIMGQNRNCLNLQIILGHTIFSTSA